MSPRGRYAPSPTGELHLGNASTALLSWLSVRSRGGAYVMRIEDLDRNRVRAGLAEQILDDLAWLGLDWDEGPRRGGPHAPYEQSRRTELYRSAFDRLRREERVYPCFCSRKDIAAAASAPQSPGEELRYPGICRGLDPAAAAGRVAAGERHAWRFRVATGDARSFDDLGHGRWGADRPPPGDFVLWRSDEVPAYQLAVVVDDAAMEIDEVVRGDDLLASSVRQILLCEALDYPVPRFGHVRLLLGPDGVRLSKRHDGVTLRELRERGFAAETIVGRLACAVGLTVDAKSRTAASLVGDFGWSALPPCAEGTTIDPLRW